MEDEEIEEDTDELTQLRKQCQKLYTINGKLQQENKGLNE
jgi:hypothetical protein